MNERRGFSGRDFFTDLEVMQKAAQHKGLVLRGGGSMILSDPFATYVLTDDLLAALNERGIKRQPRPDCNNDIFTLIDENPQKEVPGWAPSNYWNFKEKPEKSGRFNLEIELRISFHNSTEKRGVEFRPKAFGTFLSPTDSLPNFRMFKAMVELGGTENLPVVAKELAQSDGIIVIHWAKLGLGGIRTTSALFQEFSIRGREEIEELARHHDIFHPAAYPKSNVFVIEPKQYQVIQIWCEQLEEYRQRLVI